MPRNSVQLPINSAQMPKKNIQMDNPTDFLGKSKAQVSA